MNAHDAFGFISWLYAVYSFFLGLCRNSWWQFLLAITIGLHSRFPCPLGQIPPIVDSISGWFFGNFSVPLLFGVIVLSYFVPSKRTILLVSSFMTVARLIRLKWVPNESRKSFELPWLLRLHPYFMLISENTLPGPVVINTIKYRDNLTLDIWQLTDSAVKPRPTLFYIHGGGWLAGEARRHTQVKFLHQMALSGHVVIACNYRKSQWPHQIDDCASAFQWVLDNASRSDVNADISRITLSGASAGGHLALLLYLRFQDRLHSTHSTSRGATCTPTSVSKPADGLSAEGIKNNKGVPSQPQARAQVTSMVLFYPAVDPADDTCQCAQFPISLTLLRVKRGQSLMRWFFERAVLRDDVSFWTSASPLRLMVQGLQRRRGAGRKKTTWPATMVVHGELDGITPIEHSHTLLHTIATVHRMGDDDDDDDDGDVDFGNGLGAERADDDEGASTEARERRWKEVLRSPDTFRVRPQDTLLAVPLMKHSFESGDAAVVDWVIQRVQVWLRG